MGSRDLPPLTFIPGAAGLGAFWDPVVQLLPGDFAVRLHDLPGLGAAAAVTGVNGYDDLVAHIAQAIDEPTILVAQSMGAYVALAVALRYPPLIRGLVLTAAAGGIDMRQAGATDWRPGYAASYPNAAAWARDAVPDLGERIREIPCPTLLIWATGDAISPLAVAHALAAQLRRVTLVTFDTDDHWVARRFAPDVAQAIASFARAHVSAP